MYLQRMEGFSARSLDCRQDPTFVPCVRRIRGMLSLAVHIVLYFFFIIYLALTEGKKWWKYSSLLALRVQRRRSLWLIEENVVGVTEFNSSRRRLERSACERGEGDAGEQLWAKGEKAAAKLSHPPVAPPGGREA